ncbi:MAG: sulfite exporter TauE/SafE family protein [Dehalococcoidia bacterium]
MDFLDACFLAAAAFAAGAINAVAGGGSLVSFPALLGVGYASKTSNVTNTVALWPGYIGGSYGYRGELKRQRSRILALTLPSVLGALAGSAILLGSSESFFDSLVPFLIIFACGLMLIQDRLAAWAQRHRMAAQPGDAVPIGLHIAVFFLAVYGAYFGAGLGIITLAFLGILLPDELQHSNALKGLLSALINFVAVVYFAFFGPVEWAPAAVMAIAALAGGYLGVDVARKLGKRWLRITVVAYGLVVAGVLLVK